MAKQPKTSVLATLALVDRQQGTYERQGCLTLGEKVRCIDCKATREKDRINNEEGFGNFGFTGKDFFTAVINFDLWPRIPGG